MAVRAVIYRKPNHEERFERFVKRTPKFLTSPDELQKFGCISSGFEEKTSQQQMISDLMDEMVCHETVFTFEDIVGKFSGSDVSDKMLTKDRELFTYVVVTRRNGKNVYSEEVMTSFEAAKKEAKVESLGSTTTKTFILRRNAKGIIVTKWWFINGEKAGVKDSGYTYEILIEGESKPEMTGISALEIAKRKIYKVSKINNTSKVFILRKNSRGDVDKKWWYVNGRIKGEYDFHIVVPKKAFVPKGIFLKKK